MYPAMLNLTNKKVTIIGGGKVAYRKSKTLLNSGAKLVVVSPIFCPKLLELDIPKIFSEYKEEYLEGNFLIIAATNNAKINMQIGLYCEKKQILCNIVDNKELSSFIVPAVFKQGDLTISVSTNGKSPILASQIKEELSYKYDASYKDRLEILGKLRNIIFENEDNIQKRKQIFGYISSLSLEELKEYEKSYFMCKFWNE